MPRWARRSGRRGARRCGIGLLSGITVPALKDGRSLADPGLPGRSRIGADELDDDARHPATADHARRPPPARAHHAGRTGRRAHRRRRRADGARGAARLHGPLDAGAVHAADRSGAARRDRAGVGARRPLDAPLRPRRGGRVARVRRGVRWRGAPDRRDRRIPRRVHRRRGGRRVSRPEGAGIGDSAPRPA